MADAEERARKREERRQKRKEKEELRKKTNGTNDHVIHDTPGINLNGDPDISRETEEGLEQKSDAALPDVVKVPSGLNENWERPVTPEIDEQGFALGKSGYKSYSSAVAAQGGKSALQKKKEQYANTALLGQRDDSEEEAEFEPEVQPARNEVQRSQRPALDTEQEDDEWSNLPQQRSTGQLPVSGRPKNQRRTNEGDFYTEEELRQIDQRSETSSESGNRSRKVSDDWRSYSTTKTRGVNKPKSKLKKSDSWIRERPELPEEPVLKEPEWLDLVRKRRWRSTVKARFPQTERERIQFERRLDTSKKGLKFNPRGEPTGITGPEMDDELSMYLIQQRRRIQSDDVFESSLASSSRSAFSDRSYSDSDYGGGEFTFDQDPRMRELAAEKGILNLSRPPIKGPRKEVHKNLAMERSRQSTMKWRFSIDPHEDPLWTQLPRPTEIQAINDMEGSLEAKFWSSKRKFQTGQFNPPPVLPKPRSRSSSGLSRSHSSSEADFMMRSSHGGSSEEMTPSASKSAVKDMRERLASGDFKTSTPLRQKPVELDREFIPRLRDLQQKLASEAESSENKVEKPSYISQEELEWMGERKKSLTEEMFTEKIDEPKLEERPRAPRRRSDAEFIDLLASRKQEADATAVEMSQEISSVATDISKAFGKLGTGEQELDQENRRKELEEENRKKELEEQRRQKEKEEEKRQKKLEEEKRQKELEEERQRKEREEEQRLKELEEEHRRKQEEEERRQKEQEEEQRQKELEQEKEQSRMTSPEFLVKLKDCEVLEGNELCLEVVVSGEPQPVVEWFLDYRVIKNSKQHKVVSHGAVHSLSIPNIQVEDEGIYECVATNSMGKAICDCEVLVNE